MDFPTQSSEKKLLSTSSWFQVERFSTKEKINLKKELLLAFSEEGDIVFDPFLEKGETVFACHKSERNGISMSSDGEAIKEVEEKIKPMEGQLHLSEYGAKQSSKQLLLYGKLKDLDYVWQQYSLPELDVVLTFLPSYQELEKNYVEGLGVIEYLEKVFFLLKNRVKFGSYILIMAENTKNSPNFAWDLAKALENVFQFKGEKICCVSSTPQHENLEDFLVTHKYLLIFRKIEI